MRWVRAAVLRVAVLAALWWAISEGADAWRYGVPAVVAVAVATLITAPPPAVPVARRRPAVRLRAALRIVGWFARESVAGAVDVGRRALRRRVDIAPFDAEFPVALRSSAGRVVFAGLAALTPGSLTVELVDGPEPLLALHILHPDIAVVDALEVLQRHLVDLLDPRDTPEERTPS